MSDVTPSNSTVARPLRPVLWKTGACPAPAVRSRPLPLLSCHAESAAPSAAVSLFASYQSWSPVVVGGDADIDPVTTAVRADAAEVEPLPLLAVTTTRSVPPTSPETTTYDAAAATGRFAQTDPAASQRCH